MAEYWIVDPNARCVDHEVRRTLDAAIAQDLQSVLAHEDEVGLEMVALGEQDV